MAYGPKGNSGAVLTSSTCRPCWEGRLLYSGSGLGRRALVQLSLALIQNVCRHSLEKRQIFLSLRCGETIGSTTMKFLPIRFI
jgi:hypothetical protein